MLGLFRSKPLLDENSAAWMFEAFAWAMRNLGRDIFLQHTKLVTPSNEFFPDRIENPAGLPEMLFRRVRNYAGMAEWDCELVAQDPDPNLHVAPTVIIRNAEQSPAGTFLLRQGENKPIITYNPSLVRTPERFIATMAHELAHYLSTAIEEPPPGGEDYHEHATDLLAIFMGFGLFQLNSTFSFRAYNDQARGMYGWSTQRLGYLTPKESAFALAIFCALKGISVDVPQRFLRNPQLGFFKQAMRDVSTQREAMAGIMADATTSTAAQGAGA